MPAEAYGITEFLAKTYEAKQPVFGRWLASGELCLLYAPTGQGKSWFCASLGHAVATGGSFLGQKAVAPRRVAYVEAEMTPITFQTRLRRIDDAAPTSCSPSNFLVIRRNESTHYLPNIHEPSGAAELLTQLQHSDLIILDNLSNLATPLGPHDSDVSLWRSVKQFLFILRDQQKTVILVHHAGKSGLQLGTVMKENDMDSILHLQAPVRPLNKDKLSIELRTEKCRSQDPKDQLNLYAEFSIENDRVCWTWMPLLDARKHMVKYAAQFMKNKLAISNALRIPYLEVLEALKDPLPSNEPEDYSDIPF